MQMLKSVVKRTLRSCGVEIKKIAAEPACTAIPIDYPVNPRPRWGHGSPLHPQITAALDKGRDRYAEILDVLAQYQAALYAIAAVPDPAFLDRPAWGNRFMEGLDAVALSCLLMDRKPPRYVEIGSGNSTMFARHFDLETWLWRRLWDHSRSILK